MFPTSTRGFTLIELLVVIAIIGILSSVVLVSLNSARMKARDTRRIADLNQIRLALELYYDDKGYYPPTDCAPSGWDCNGYRNSYSASSWAALAAELQPYLPQLPVDPINTACAPWNNNCFSYAYGNVGRTTYPAQYDLTAQLESTSNPQRCAVKLWRFYFNNQPWCGSYSGQLYEASPR
ncbi:MAG TPA: prepilin-type N-terminal cleavage/methylation domain-containing protein [Candidatus Paceibacterota bacterium]|nr:prepilin-type N-terminal cleavage/methylation domain-containing protein [Candidatus Paceibacterota bacterium]